jgi:phosphogluconate dehydratase
MTQLHSVVNAVTQRIIERSRQTRDDYVQRMEAAVDTGVKRAHLSCGNVAHACAASTTDEKGLYVSEESKNIGIVTAYNDMLSAHQPFQHYPDIIKQAALQHGATAQVAGGVPAMCDGVTQGQAGMELSLFSRDVIAMSTAVALSHQCFDAAIFLGVCDKIIPGMTIAAASFGHLPIMMMPAGPMPSGIANEEKASVRRQYATGEADKIQLLDVEMGSYHSPGTCTFYGTANTNQLIMEIMGFHLPGASFVNPDTPLRDALTGHGVQRLLELTKGEKEFTPAYRILSEKNFVNGLVGLLASGGSTNLVIHMVAMARAAGIILDLQDFSDLSAITPLISRVYPNGWADINSFQDAGGMPVFISGLLEAGFLHNDVSSVAGDQLSDYCQTPTLNEDKIQWSKSENVSNDASVLVSARQPFSPTGGLVVLDGNLGRCIIKTSALAADQLVIRAPARVFSNQEELESAFQADELNQDCVCVVRFQGPQANGMPELHGLTPILSALQTRGHKVALVTDGRMSGASGKIPAAIHVSPEALVGGAINKIRDGDIILLDAEQGILSLEIDDLSEREAAVCDLSADHVGCGRELFAGFRQKVSAAADGACVLFPQMGQKND